MKPGFKIIFCIVAFGIFVNVAHAKEDGIVDNDQLIYEKPTMEKLSQLYIGLSRVDLDNDLVVQEYLHINECDIVKKYFYNEFEWQKIRDLSRKYLKKKKNEFQTRFEVIQPIHLGEYDFERGGFEVVDDYKINGIRRFEVIAIDGDDKICGVRRFHYFSTGLVVELSRPVTFDFMPMDDVSAKILLAEKNKEHKDDLKHAKKLDDVYETRDVYMSLQVKFFASQGDVRMAEGGHRAKMLAVLEGLKIYQNLEKTKILYEKTFRSKKASRKVSENLFEQIEELKKKRAALIKKQKEEKQEIDDKLKVKNTSN